MIRQRIPSAVERESTDPNPQVAKCAYATHEQEGRRDDHADQDRAKAEKEIR